MSVECSQEWKDIVKSGERLTAQCPFCLSTLYATGDESLWAPSKLAEIRNAHQWNADRYQGFHGRAMLEVGVLSGRDVVFGCECGKLENFERWVWDARHTILPYISLRASNMLTEAQVTIGRCGAAELALKGVKP